MIRNRCTAANPLSLSSVAAYAVIGAAKAMPVSSAAGTASTTSQLSAAPKSTRTARNSAADVVTRNATYSSWPTSRSGTRVGVASTAS